MTFLYDISIFFYRLSILIASLFNSKAKKWIEGRKDFFDKLDQSFANRKKSGKLIWFHCASLGEFEQARPLIEKIKGDNQVKILITFFSPSGFEIRKNYAFADYIMYLPADTASNAKKFIKKINPSLAIFVKYEFWFHYLDELNKNNIPVYLVSASFRNEQVFFKWYGSWFRKMLLLFKQIFVQDQNSASLLKEYNIQSIISGDTRFDRVYATALQSERIPLIEKFSQNKKILIAGSTWPDDEKLFKELSLKNFGLHLIIAPHEIRESRINEVESLFHSYKTLRFSKADAQNIIEAEVLIIDNIGMLSRLYRYGKIAYVGGAFGTSLHNILEAAAFGLPVLFGPNHHKFWEAAALIEKGGAFSVNDGKEMNSKINFLLQDEMILKIASEMSRNFVRSNTGATGKIMDVIKKDLES